MLKTTKLANSAPSCIWMKDLKTSNWKRFELSQEPIMKKAKEIVKRLERNILT